MSFSGKKLLLLGFAIVLLIAIPLTVYLVGQQSKTKVGASPSTTLTIAPPAGGSNTVAVGQPLIEDIWADPGGVNQISFVKLTITYDPTKLTAGTTCLAVNTQDFPSTLQGPTCSSSGTITVTVSAGNTPTQAVSTKKRIATITFTAAAAGTTDLKFTQDTTQNSPTQVLSVGQQDQFNENVLSAALPTTITITGGTASPSPSSSPGSTGSTALPICANLALDRAQTGTAPYALTFTASGNGVNGATISKVSFIFGDGTTQDVTTGAGGIGTGTLTGVPVTHSYSTAGTFSSKVTLTDNKGAVSDATTASCNKTITVSAATTGSGGGTGGNVVVNVPAATATPAATLAPTPAATATPLPVLPPTGPMNIISAGAVGAVLSVLGAIIFFAL